MDKNFYCLAPWDHQVSYSNHKLLIRVHNGTIDFVSKKAVNLELNGIYAKYPQGVFCIFIDNTDNLFFCWNSQFIKYNPKFEVLWEVKNRHYFKVIDGDTELLNISYSQHKYMLSHILESIFMLQGDWWQLQADLPSWIESSIRPDSLIKNIKSVLNDESS